MASGYEVDSTDLDSILAPYVSGWPQANATGYQVESTDFNARYAPLSSGTAAAATGYDVAGADFNTIFAGYGTTGVAVGTQPGDVSQSYAAGYPSGAMTSNTTTCAGIRGKGSYTYAWEIVSGSASLTAPDSATCGVTDSAVSAGSTLSGTMRCLIGDGTTSVYTNTVDWSLTNTTPDYLFDGSIVSSTYSTSNGNTESTVDGYYPPFAGSISPTNSLRTGQTITQLGNVTVVDIPSGVYQEKIFGIVITGFSSDPGISFFSTLIINGTPYTSSSAAYAYSDGIANWQWTNQYALTDGDTYPVTIAP